MNTAGISSNAFFGNSANYFFEPLNSLDAKLLLTFDLFCWLGHHFVFVTLRYWQCWRRQFSTIFL